MIKLTLILFFLFFSYDGNAQTIKVGSKKFTENYILAEIISQLLEGEGYNIQRKFGLDGAISYQALLNGEIDVYPEYTGTISHNYLKNPQIHGLKSINKALSPLNLLALEPFGFNNTYAIAVRKEIAENKSLVSIKDLQKSRLIGALSYEFTKRADGWPGMKERYHLDLPVKTMEHSLAYEALTKGVADFTDAYSTDAKLKKFGMRVLKDDLEYFPKYLALPFVNKSLNPKIINILSRLQGVIDEEKMLELNSHAEFGDKSFSQIAKDFLIENQLRSSSSYSKKATLVYRTGNVVSWKKLFSQTQRHLYLTFSAIFLAIALAIPLGAFLYFHKKLAAPVLIISGLLQTIPSIALLAFMIPVFGIGVKPAIAALFLFSILPILRNTYTALDTIDPRLIEAARGIGLTGKETMFFVQWPLAIPVILAGVRTATIISVGTATLAAFIGAGGLGESIVTGLALNDNVVVLQGAIPSALLAIFLELIFEIIEKRVEGRLK